LGAQRRPRLEQGHQVAPVATGEVEGGQNRVLLGIGHDAGLVGGVGLGELADADLVIGCVDTIRARVQLLGRCALVDAPLIDGGTSPWGAELRIRVSPDEACFACTLSPHQRSASDLPWSCSEPLPDELPQAAAIATTAVAAGWLATVAFGLLFGKPPSYRLLTMDVDVGRAAPVTAARDPQCPLHRPLSGPVILSPAGSGSTVAEFLKTVDTGDEACTWNSFPMAKQPRRRETRSTRLRDADPDATLADLGVAPQELIPVLTAGGDLVCHRLRRPTTAEMPR